MGVLYADLPKTCNIAAYAEHTRSLLDIVCKYVGAGSTAKMTLSVSLDSALLSQKIRKVCINQRR